MSCFMVAASHIDAILSAVSGAKHARLLYVNQPGAEHRTFDMTTDAGLTELGRILWAANLDSVLHRYSKDEPGDHEDVTGYRFRRRNAKVTPLAALKLLNSLDYQSCELPEWHTTLARAIITAMIHVLVCELPGYDDAPWALEVM